MGTWWYRTALVIHIHWKLLVPRHVVYNEASKSSCLLAGFHNLLCIHKSTAATFKNSENVHTDISAPHLRNIIADKLDRNITHIWESLGNQPSIWTHEPFWMCLCLNSLSVPLPCGEPEHYVSAWVLIDYGDTLLALIPMNCLYCDTFSVFLPMYCLYAKIPKNTTTH